jgi:phospholipid-binding lipoprotein MlaA
MAKKFLTIALCAFIALGTASCAKSQDPNATYKSSELNDPIEPVNRAIFAFNNVLDIIIVEPVAKIYNAVFPGFVRDGVQNFMRNLRSPLIVANNLLQGDFGDAGVATARFVINTTVGIGGLVDVAGRQGLAYESEDLGQTLGVWGVGNGMYIVLPIFGPSSLRDTTGMVGDYFADPLRIWTHNTDNEWIYYTRGIVEGIDNRSRLIKAVEDLRKNSLDYYAAVRSAYAQKRAALIRDENPDSTRANVPDYDAEY